MNAKIAVIASSIHPIRQRHLLDWYEDLRKKNLKTQLFLGSRNTDIPLAINYKINSKLENLKYSIVSLFKSNTKIAGLKKIQPLVNYSPRIIHLLTSNAFANIWPLLEDKNIKLIVSFRGFDINVYPFQSDENREFTQRIFEKADVLHFISEDLKKSAIQMNADPEKCIVIRRSIRTTEKERSKFSKPVKNRLVVLTVGRLVWEKGYLYALETMAILKKRGYDFEYQIAGKGVDYNMLNFHVKRLNINDRVRFLGELTPEEVKDKLMKADIYFQPSLTEALSLALIEASFYGLPIVSTNIGGIPEVVVDQVSGFLSSTCDSNAFSNNIIKLLEDKNLRTRMGSAANKQIVNKFSREIEIQKWKEVYASLGTV